LLIASPSQAQDSESNSSKKVQSWRNYNNLGANSKRTTLSKQSLAADDTDKSKDENIMNLIDAAHQHVDFYGPASLFDEESVENIETIVSKKDKQEAKRKNDQK
jgi:hypothetical protein